MSEQQQYLIIASHLRSAIQSGELQPGDKLPSEAHLSQQFMSSRGTVRHALEKLRSEGLISSHQGRRSQVLLPALSQDFGSVVSFSYRCRESGITPGQSSYSWETMKATPSLAENLRCSPATSILKLIRLRLMNDRPTMVERMYFPPEIASYLKNPEIAQGSMYQHLRECGIDISHAHSTVATTHADPNDARLLNIAEQTILFTVSQYLYTAEGQPVCHSEQRYLPGTVSFSVNNLRGRPSASVFAPRLTDG